jgi:hypothetical protein
MSSSCSSFVNVTLYFTIAVFDGKSTNIKRQYQVDMTIEKASIYIIHEQKAFPNLSLVKDTLN